MNPKHQAAQHDPKSTERKSVVIIGLDLWLIYFSSPDFVAFPGLTVEKVLAGITSVEEDLKALGYDAQRFLLILTRQQRLLTPQTFKSINSPFFDWCGRQSLPE